MAAIVNTAIISTLVNKYGVPALMSQTPTISLMDRSKSGPFMDKTYDSGTTIYTRVEDQPAMPTESAVMNPQAITQRQIGTTLRRFHEAALVSDVQQEYEYGGMEGLMRNVFKSRLQIMGVQANILCEEALVTCPNFFGTAGAQLTTGADWAAGKAILDNQLAVGNLYALMSPDTMTGTAAALAAAFNPTRDSSNAYLDGKVQRAMDLGFYTSSTIPNHTNGDAVGNGTSGMILNTNVTTGDTSIAVTGGTASGVIKKNSLIYIKGYFGVQPNTKKVLLTKKYFTVAEDLTLSGGAGTLKLTQAIYGPENGKLQNISVLPVTSGGYVGIVGTASHTYQQALVFKEKCAAFYSLRLPELPVLETARTEQDGVSLLTSEFGDGINMLGGWRVDMLIAATLQQPLHAARAFTADLGILA